MRAPRSVETPPVPIGRITISLSAQATLEDKEAIIRVGGREGLERKIRGFECRVRALQKIRHKKGRDDRANDIDSLQKHITEHNRLLSLLL